ncbi:aspartate--tRNA ligase [Candidatus Peregrinibacteria bacterium]|nr:aspartate--tRNA ligase [Candidatus Peregrinibacteria bacterium]
MFRTHTCNQLGKNDVGAEVTLSGWVHRRRDHGDLIFIDLRDRYGFTQIVADPSHNSEAHKVAEELRSEFVIMIKGTVRARPKGMENKNIDSGEIEVVLNRIEILNRAKTPPFEIDIEADPNEEIRLKYRYLDLRRERMKKNLVFRHKFIKRLRDHMDEMGFVEIETPMLMKGTPEGSREFIVPSRLYEGKFYVLPQSPQQLKQLLMVAGMDKYFQIARCFRDEDQRGDRQPEFTQMDLEMSFVEEEDVIETNESVLIKLLEELAPDKKIMFKPFKRMTWHDAMSKYGSDKPDLRFGMEIMDVSDLVSKSEFKVFTDAIKNGGVVKCLRVEGGAVFTRKEIDQFTEIAKIYGAKGLAYITLTKEEGVKSPIAKFFKEEQIDAIVKACGAMTGDIVFFAADMFNVACNALGNVRLAAADKFQLRDKDKLALVWVTDFPMFEYSEEEGKLVATHHPFTAPKDSDIGLLDTDPVKALAKAYDIVMNGSEIGGGSIRIHSPLVQRKIFEVLGINDADVERRFGHLLEAFQYGAPPHGGIAWGLDRIVMLLCDEANIREVIAFPKDSRAKDLMTGAPSELPAATLKEMNIKIA